ncbi:protein FAM171A1-like isoform X1 [Acipenser oxyrinchus oxyrinchus]|uniref:Protein FAM171A1-like isoform X1 n=1 Tax=Acipenser oxyrinchus oxyrinchus TaxID=40147 RepID=A0AAD8GEW5_ACIOX|nr:protein FAM171A1-like isoform X1 [Acipenser oxyrinchus oxyrinchus]
MRLEMSRSAALLLCLLGCNVWKAVTKTLQEEIDAKEVTLKVHVSDASTHQPIAGATIEIFINQTSLTSETSGADGNTFIKFNYRLGTLLIVMATKQGYVPNSVPWRPTRLPVFSSLSLELLPERSATLMVYEDIVQIVSGFQGARVQPRVQFQRRALSLPQNSTYSNLTAFLTAACSPWEVDSFPYLQGLEGNRTGNSSRFELTPVTAVSIHLLGNDGAEILVSGPIYVTVPLPANSNLKENDHIPAWSFDQKLGAWLKSSLGFVQKEGNQLTLTYIAPHLGYWVAAMSPLNTGPVVAKDISTYHTVFLLAILGGMAVILLVLLCLLLYYCRRKCLKPRQHHRKLPMSSALEGSKKDQATSMSQLHLISEVHMEMVSSSGEADMRTPMLKPSYNTSRDFSSREELMSQHEDRDKTRSSLNNLTHRGTSLKEYHKSMETFHLKSIGSNEPSEGYESPARDEYRRSYNSVSSQALLEKGNKQVQASVNHLSAESKSSTHEATYQPPCTPDQEQVMNRRPPDYLMSRSVDHLERPTCFPHTSQLICCSSVDQVNDSVYRKGLPTLVIPAHYMKLPGEHPFAGQPLLLQTEHQSDLERLQAELSASHQPLLQQPPEPMQLSAQDTSQQNLLDPQGTEWNLQSTSMSESMSIPASLSEAGLVQMNGEVQLLAEKTLMELRGGKPLPHPRAWFVSLDGRSNAHIRHSYIDLQRAGKNGSNDASLDSGVDINEPKSARKNRIGARERKIQKVMAYTQLVYVDDVEQNGSEHESAIYNPEDNALGPVLDGTPRPEDDMVSPEQQQDIVTRTVEAEPQPESELPTSPEHDTRCNDDGREDENKKSPWQKREERPLMSFNLK